MNQQEESVAEPPLDAESETFQIPDWNDPIW